MKKPFFWSVGSGLVWIGVASAVTYAIYPTGFSTRHFAGMFAGGVVAAPVIGLLIGYIARWFSDLDRMWCFWMALGNLYLATYLFLLASGIGHVVSEWITHRHLQTVQRQLVVDPFAGALFGLTYTGFVLVLLPLSYWNHALIGKAWRETSAYGQSC